MAAGSSRSNSSRSNSSRSNSVQEVLDKNMLSTKLEEADSQNPQKQKLVVLEFMANWNVPCKNMKKDLDTMAAEFADRVMFLALNIDKFKDIADDLSVQVLPTFLLVKGYYVEDEVIGVKKKELEEKIRKHTDNVRQ